MPCLDLELEVRALQRSDDLSGATVVVVFFLAAELNRATLPWRKSEPQLCRSFRTIETGDRAASCTLRCYISGLRAGAVALQYMLVSC